jgi:signal transduction histidine kinase
MSTDRVNILLVDDQPGKLLTYEAMLAGLGENLVKATSGDEALQHLLKTEFAVILVDVCMPQLDGFELATMIRQHPRCQKSAIIFISAIQVTNLDQLKGYEHGAVDYVSVPVVPELLRARVAIFADLYRKTAALERVNLELEKRVAERTADLERDLAERKRLELALLESARRKDEFLAVLAHELRNPLAPIRTAVDLMSIKKLADPDLAYCRNVIDRQVEHLKRLVDDLMDVSRISRGKINLDRKPLDLGLVVGRALEIQQPGLDARRQKINLEFPKQQPLLVNGDLTRLSAALGNLLNNASKYSDENARINLKIEAAGGEVLLRVQDSGMGIPPEMLPRVFEIFTQVDHTLQRSQGGLGIGLAVVRQLMELHGGSVEGHSDGVGKGSEFVLRLPLLPADQPLPAPQREFPKPLAQRRMLVVDDNNDAALTLAALLRLNGAQIETAHDGPDALAAADRFQPEAVLLDLGMPGMSGLDVARTLRMRPYGAGLQLIALTGWGQEQDQRRTREAGFDAHITKPVDYARLTQLLAETRPKTALPAERSPADSDATIPGYSTTYRA